MKVGDSVPNFSLKDENGNEFELYRNLDKDLLLVFYPKDNTPVCSRQLADYNKSLDEFSRNDIKVVGINTGSQELHSRFCSRLKLNFPLLSDPDKSVSRLYNSINIFGTNKRNLVLVGRSKKILWINNRVSFSYLNAQKVIKKVRKILLPS